MGYRKAEVVSDLKHLPISKIKEVCSTQPLIDRWAYILHDKDTYTLEDEAQNPEHKTGTPKPAHIHLTLFFGKKNGKAVECQMEQIAKWFGLASNFVSCIRSEVGALRYLIHMDYPEKYQYQPSEVFSNFDYMSAIQKTSDKEIQSRRKEEIITNIVSGEYKMSRITEHVSEMEYVKMDRDIQKALEYRIKKMLAQRHKNMEVIYIYGVPGSGKTEYAKALAERCGKTYYISEPGKDFVDGYTDEECFILDDPRAGHIRPETLLKFLDPRTATKTSSRFHNKLVMSDLIIITTPYEPLTFFRSLLNDSHLEEPVSQFTRRCQYVYEFTNTDIIYRRFNPDTKAYEAITAFPNTHVSSAPFKPDKNNLEFLDSYLLQKACCIRDEDGKFRYYERNEDNRLMPIKELTESEVCEQFPTVAKLYHLVRKPPVPSDEENEPSETVSPVRK